MELYQRPSIALTLPSELVIGICRTYLDNVKRQTHYCRLSIINDSEPLKNVINVSQVCRRWHDVITNCPELWCHFINPHHPVSEWTQLLLQRSKQVGITYVSHSPDVIREVSALFREVAYADRLVSYSVALQLGGLIWDELDMPMHWPQLQFLCLTHLAQSVVPDQLTLRGEHLLLSTGFPSCTSTPKLERLHLHSCAFGDVSQITGLKTLKELYVSGVRMWTIPQWLEIIKQLPHLRSLTLDHAILRVTRDRMVWDEMGPNRMFDLELEEFCLRDKTSLCAEFFQYFNITTSSVFQLECLYDEALSDPEVQASFIYHRITPIVHKLITTNPVFSNCALRAAGDTIQCLGLPENSSLDESPWPDQQYSGTYLSNGGCITILMEVVDYQNYARMFKQLLQPIFSCVDSLTIVSNGHPLFEADIWLSDLLWQSSHRLRQLLGVSLDAWTIVNLNMFSLPDSGPLYPATVPFLYALEELELCIDTTCGPLVAPFFDRKIAMGNPLKRFKHIIPLCRFSGRYPINLVPGEFVNILSDEGSPEPGEVFMTNPLEFDFEDTSLIDHATSAFHHFIGQD